MTRRLYARCSAQMLDQGRRRMRDGEWLDVHALSEEIMSELLINAGWLQLAQRRCRRRVAENQRDENNY